MSVVVVGRAHKVITEEQCFSGGVRISIILILNIIIIIISVLVYSRLQPDFFPFFLTV